MGETLGITRLIRDVPDFPKKGIVFRDLSTLFKNPAAFKQVIDRIYERYKHKRVDSVLGIEARGFIVGAPLAYKLEVGFIPARKKGKLPWKTARATYQLEYGEEALEIHEDGITSGQRVLIVDDLLATGGTALAAAQLVERLGGEVAGIAFIVELAYLEGRKKISKYDVLALASYEHE